ncbi:MAG: transporter substrate-binding domain-containing protein [Deltaproteobacteria bacterium]|nr:transporter substrate-binding domain-containing protein [Deltaproteobacteria bacterium]
MKKIIFVFCILSLVLCGCTKKEEAKMLKVAACPMSPPNMYEENGKYQGLDLEIFEGFCKVRGYQYKIMAYDWQGMLGAVISGQADVAFSGISITEKRKEKMDFSEPYMDNTWNLVSLKKRNIRIKDLADLKKYSIGYPRGMAYSAFIKDDLEPKGIYMLSSVKMYPTYNEVLADLQNGNLDLAFLDGSVAGVYKKKIDIQDSYVFTGFDTFGFAFPTDSALRDDFNRYMKELGPEKLKALVDKWMG